MSGIFDGQREANYRERSNNASMLAVAFTPALDKCTCCGKRRTVVTGSYKNGKFICGQCRPVFARIADKTKPASQGGNPQPASNQQEQF